MKYALFIAEKPSESEDTKSWDSFVAFAKDSIEKDQRQTTAPVLLNEGTYLFDLNNGLHSLTILVGHAQRNHISSRTLFFDQYPLWVYDKA